jgi:tetratricopeptide (TPR) repeat protein
MAVQADPLDSRAQLCLAWSYAMLGHYQQALPYFKYAVDLNENDTWTLVSACQGFAFLSDHEQSLFLENKLLAYSDSLNRTQWAYLVGARFLRKDYQGAIYARRMAGDIVINLPGWNVAALVSLGQIKEAEQELQHFFSLVKQQWKMVYEPTNEQITRWFLQCFPIQSREEWENLRDGLHRAGAYYLPYEQRFPTYIATKSKISHTD